MKAAYLAAVLLVCPLSLPAYAAHSAQATPIQQGVSEKTNINQASAKDLIHKVKGIGIKRAEAIVKYREANHGFKSLDDLAKVPGLGASFVAKNRVALAMVFSLG